MIGILLLALLAQPEVKPDAKPLDGAELRQAMEIAAETRDAGPLIGRKFRVVVPFTDQRALKYRAFKQSARWDYDSRKKRLITSIGLGEITSQNFDAFQENRLSALPPLQTLYFEVESSSTDMPFSRQTPGRGIVHELGKRTRAASFGLAIPYQANGPSGLPEGYRPLVYSELARPEREAVRWAKQMNVVFEGQITDMGLKPEVFCGAYRGMVTAKDVTGYTPFLVTDRQCFITARIDRVEVLRGGSVVAHWRKPPKQGF
jgi:hypothetical protein